MDNFTYYTPTKLFVGKDSHKNIGEVLKNYDFNKIVMIYGGGSIKTNHVYDDVLNSLNNSNIQYIEISGVEANPKLSFVKNAKKVIVDYKPDMILAIGGGSVIDACKLLTHCYYYNGNPFDFNMGIIKPSKVLPLGVILTISAAGSEMSSSCVISNDEVTPFIKKGFNSDLNRPLFAILNPETTYSVNTFQTGCGIVDIMMHTLERFMNVNDDSLLADNFAIGLLKTVMHYGKIAISNPNDYDARLQLMLASSFSHNGLTSIGKNTSMRVHGLEHVLSGVHDDVAHGAGLSILWPAWSKVALSNKKAEEKFKILACHLFNCDTASEGVNKLKEYFKSINMPTSFKELKTKDKIEPKVLADNYVKLNSKIFNDYIPLNYENVLKIYRIANDEN